MAGKKARRSDCGAPSATPALADCYALHSTGSKPTKILWRPTDPATAPLSGGMLREKGAHFYDLACWIAQDEPLSVFAAGACLIDPRFEDYGDVDTAALTLRLAGGAIASFDFSRHSAYGYDERIEVQGCRGHDRVASTAAAGCFALPGRFRCGRWSSRRVKTRDGLTALMAAASAGRADFVGQLLDRGALVDSRAEDGRSALMFAAAEGHTGVIEALLAKAADATARDAAGRTALVHAAAAGHDGAARLLESAGAEEDLDQLLRIVASTGRADRVELLVADGADPDGRDPEGNTPLMLAAAEGRSSTVAALIAHGAEVNLATPKGATALMLAAGADHATAVRTLLKQGAAADAKTSDGRTALMMAAFAGNAGVVEILAESGSAVYALERGRQYRTAVRGIGRQERRGDEIA